jgi:hypothetical protein
MSRSRALATPRPSCAVTVPEARWTLLYSLSPLLFGTVPCEMAALRYVRERGSAAIAARLRGLELLTVARHTRGSGNDGEQGLGQPRIAFAARKLLGALTALSIAILGITVSATVQPAAAVTGYHTTASPSLSERTGPGTSYATIGSPPTARRSTSGVKCRAVRTSTATPLGTNSRTVRTSRTTG